MPSSLIKAIMGAPHITAAKPVLAIGGSAGVFTITNYDSTLAYTLTPTSGSAVRSGNTITLSGAVNTVCTVTARYPRSLIDSSSSAAERKKYTAVQGDADISLIHAPPAHGVSIPDVIGAHWLYCNQFPVPLEEECGHQEGTMIKGSLPSGYTDLYGEWIKVS